MDNQKIRWAYLTEAEVIMVREVLNNGYYSNIEGHELRDIATYYKNKLLLDKSSIRVILKK